MLDFFQPTEAVTMENFNKRLQQIQDALPAQNLKIATGSYVGTDTILCSLSFDFVPAFIVVISNLSGSQHRLLLVQGCIYSAASGGSHGSGQTWTYMQTVTFSEDGKTVSWTSSQNDPFCAMNDPDITYSYFAIGI